MHALRRPILLATAAAATHRYHFVNALQQLRAYGNPKGYSAPLDSDVQVGFELNLPAKWQTEQLQSLGEQYDMTQEEIGIVRERAQKRWHLKKEYYRSAYNPYITCLREGGLPFDPNMQRWASMRSDYYHYFQPGWYNFWFYAWICFGPAAILTWYHCSCLTEMDRKINEGELPYRERRYKVV